MVGAHWPIGCLSLSAFLLSNLLLLLSLIIPHHALLWCLKKMNEKEKHGILDQMFWVPKFSPRIKVWQGTSPPIHICHTFLPRTHKVTLRVIAQIPSVLLALPTSWQRTFSLPASPSINISGTLWGALNMLTSGFTLDAPSSIGHFGPPIALLYMVSP